MSAVFHNLAGMMFGGDVHDYKPAVPPYPHLVWTLFALAPTRDKIVTSVTADGIPMVQDGFKVEILVPHVPVGIPPGAIAWPAELAMIHQKSSSAPMMSVGSVTAKAKPLACGLWECFGVSINCNKPINLPTGRLLQPGTVVTQWATSDLVVALAGWLVDALFKWMMDEALKNLAERLSKPLKELLSEVFKTLYKLIEKVLNLKPSDRLKKSLRGMAREGSSDSLVNHLRAEATPIP